MRQFVVVGHEVPTDPDAISLSDIPGAGRLDLLCRCVATGVFLSHDIRESVRVHLVLDDAFTVTFDADTLRHLRPDERNVASRVRGALESAADAIGHMPADVSPGVTLRRMDLEATLDRMVAGEATCVQLHETGEPLVDVDPPADPVFVLSDHCDLTEAEATTVATAAARRIRVGPAVLHADDTMAVVHNWFDTDGYTTY
jgi:tRNA (pseudouridine54-N1)-methyltransferase